jgi:hypothetical protein
MDGAKPLRSRIDQDENGTVDRWEYYDGDGKLLKVGFSRNNTGKPDGWGFSGPDGQIARVEISSTGDEQKIDRWEYYAGAALARVELDTNEDGRVDKWEAYENGAIKTAEFDEDGDGRRDRRLTYNGAALELIESEPTPPAAHQTGGRPMTALPVSSSQETGAWRATRLSGVSPVSATSRSRPPRGSSSICAIRRP